MDTAVPLVHRTMGARVRKALTLFPSIKTEGTDNTREIEFGLNLKSRLLSPVSVV